MVKALFSQTAKNKGIDFGKSTRKLIEATSISVEVGGLPKFNLNDTLTA